MKLTRAEFEVAGTSWMDNDAAMGDVQSAINDLRDIQARVGRGSVGRAYSILITKLEEVVALNDFYFDRHPD